MDNLTLQKGACSEGVDRAILADHLSSPAVYRPTSILNATNNRRQGLVCQLCGHVSSTEVHYDQGYVGGQGYTWFTVCRSETECRQRMEDK